MTEFKHQSALEAGFRMPGEWEPHSCCWMAWPCAEAIWGDYLPKTQQGYANVANAIAAFEPVRMLTPPGSVKRARSLCTEAVEIIAWDLDDAWMRDMGPNFLTNGQGELAASVFHFNAWGGKYTWYRKDAAVGHRLAEAMGIRTFSSPVFMEGGGLNVDGEGTLLTTRQCILNSNRNPGISLEDAEQELCAALGLKKVIWLQGDPDDTETDGHVDGLACFVRPGVVLAETDPESMPGTAHHEAVQENIRILETATDAHGRRLEIHILPAASSVGNLGDRFCRSMVNFYIANGGIIMPAYGNEGDEAAFEIVSRCYPDRKVVQVDVNHIAYGGGGIHCITQQQPA